MVVQRAAARKVLEFAPIVGPRHLITATVGPSFDPVILSLDRTPDYRLETGHGGFPKKRADEPNAFRIHHLVNEEWFTFDLPSTVENYHAVQPLPGGEWLLVRGRADSDIDRNAHVFSSTGTHVRSFHAGDGIEDVQATAGGQTWISYFDEGVFGDTSLGRSGLACLDCNGRVAFRFTDIDTPIVQSMADCYAFNACSNRETWLYYYTDFPLVRLVDQKVAGSWMMPIQGSQGFAVDGERVLFGGSYEEKDVLFLGNIGTTRFQRLVPVDDAGTAVKRFRAFGRGHRLCMATDAAMYVVDLVDL